MASATTSRLAPALLIALAVVGCGGRTDLGAAGSGGQPHDAALGDVTADAGPAVDQTILDSGPLGDVTIDFRVDRLPQRDVTRDVTVDFPLPPGDATVDQPPLPDAALPDAALPDAATPDAALPDVTLPDLTRDVAVPDASTPDVASPDAALPDMSLPDAALPDVSLPDMSLPDVSPPDVSPDSPPPYDPVLAVTRARYLDDLNKIAQPRPPQSAHWQFVQSYCAKVFAEAGYTVELHAFSSGGQSGVNVIGTRPGLTRPAEQVIVSAHYDHLVGCVGADDNASGVAGVLEAARVLAAAALDRTLIVACWDLEEAGLLGSQAYAARAAQRGEQITMVYVMEMIGYRSTQPGSQSIPNEQLFALLFPQQVARIRANQYRGDFIAAFGNPPTTSALAAIETTAARVGLPATTGSQTAAILALTPLARSDHTPFWLRNFPALFLTDTAEFRNPNYHCRNGTADTVQTLDIDFAVKTTQAMVGSAYQLLNAP
ncbi:MAG: M20/M25/M40 family metallo-hydrolase [Myxococcales bacterium]|nr:M20/M25/M40 family metallo-hydrolase [Myxococcales bacterium]